MKRWIAAAISLALLPACGTVERGAPLAIEPPQERTAFVELGLDGFSSPFSRGTVIKLNEIVARSLAIIQEYDGSIGRIRVSADAAGTSREKRAEAMKGLAQLKRLSSNAKSARDDMGAAEAALKSSGEKYNDAILAGMIAFVVKVDDELRTAADEIDAKLSAD